MCVCAQSRLILCDSMNCSLPGSTVHGVFQARISEWVANSYSRRSSQPKDWTQSLVSPALEAGPGGSGGECACSAGDPDSVSGLGRFPREGNGTPLQYSAWRIPRAEELRGLQCIRLHTVRHNWVTNTSVPPGKPFIYLYVDHVSQTTYLYEIQAYLGIVSLSGNPIPKVVFPPIPP